MDKDHINQICWDYGIDESGSYSINLDGSINVANYVDFAFRFMFDLPLTFDYVGGNFDCSFNILKTLEGGPKTVMGNFDCSENKLSTLTGFPSKITGFIFLNNNPIEKTLTNFHILNKFNMDQFDPKDVDLGSWIRTQRRCLTIQNILK